MDNRNLQIEIAPEKLRSARGVLSRTETAKKLGISYQYLSMIENGKRTVPSRILIRMCVLYNITNIFDLTGAENKSSQVETNC